MLLARAFSVGIASTLLASTAVSLGAASPSGHGAFHWPDTGEAAVAATGRGLLGSSPRRVRVPIASLTKMMTALVVLRDHPLRPGEPGPSVGFASADVTDWAKQKAAGNSVVEVREGERMSELQLLEALLVPSGDNIADRLATWDAGSISAFVVKMNSAAAGWGLASTRYTDASGVDPGSASTAGDQAQLAEVLMTSPVVRWIVRRHRIDLPVVGIVRNPNPALDIGGIVGVKGGYSSHAGTCLVTAAWRARHKVLVVEVALGQPDAGHAATVDEGLLEQATAEL